jgi:hypothetical protein
MNGSNMNDSNNSFVNTRGEHDNNKKIQTKEKELKILFIKGFNTHKGTDNIYFAFDIFTLKNKHLVIEYFNYDPTENIQDVYNNLVQQIQTTKYDILIAHSLGGGLLLKYCNENDISGFQKVIFLMPYIHTNPYSLIHIASKINMNFSCIENVYLPQCLLSSNSVENHYSMIPLKQIIQSHTIVFLNEEDIVKTLNKLNAENGFFVYSKEENVSTIDSSILEQIDDIIYVDGNHTCFCERNNNSICFFKMFHDLLDDKIVKKEFNNNIIMNELHHKT